MDFDEEGPLTKEDFLSHCLIRNPKHTADLIALWQELPPLFRVRDNRQVARLPSFWKPCGQSHRVVRVQTEGEFWSVVQAIRVLLAMVPPSDLPVELVDLYRDELEYSTCTGISPEQRDKILDAVRGKWPRWSIGRLRRPHIPLWWSSRPAIVVDLDVAQRQRLLDDLPQGVEPVRPQDVFLAAPLLVPIYEDTCAKDLDWKEIGKWQQRVYGAKRRTRDPAEFRRLLEIWDRINVKGDRIPGIAHDLRQATSTVRSQYAAVNRIILGGLDDDEAEAALEAIPKVADTIDQCEACQAQFRAGRLKLCPRHERIVNEGSKSMREITGDLERIQSAREKAKTGRKGPARNPDDLTGRHLPRRPAK